MASPALFFSSVVCALIVGYFWGQQAGSKFVKNYCEKKRKEAKEWFESYFREEFQKSIANELIKPEYYDKSREELLEIMQDSLWEKAAKLDQKVSGDSALQVASSAYLIYLTSKQDKNQNEK